MTVIQPNKNKKNTLKIAIILGSLLAVALFAEVTVYFQTVNLRHEIQSASAQIDELQVKNAELKNSFYKLTDQKNFDRLAKQIGLVKDKNPKWVFASQY